MKRLQNVWKKKPMIMYKPVLRMSINALILPKVSNSYIFGMKIKSILPE